MKKGSTLDRQTSQKQRLMDILKKREQEKAEQTAEYIRKYRPTEYQHLYGTAGVKADFSGIFQKRESTSAPSTARPQSNAAKSATSVPAASSKGSKESDAIKQQKIDEENKRLQEIQEQEELAKKKAMAKFIADTIVRLQEEQIINSLNKFREEQARRNTAVMKAEYEQYKVVQRALGYHGIGLGQGSKAIASTFHAKEFDSYNRERAAIVHHWGAGGGGSHYHMASTKGYLKGDRIKGMTQRHSRQNDLRNGAKKKTQNSVNGVHNKSSSSMAIKM